MREAREVRPDLLRMAVDDAEALEHAVSALSTELTHPEGGTVWVDLVQRVTVVGAFVIGCRRVDHESEAPSHEPSLRRTADTPGSCQPGCSRECPRAGLVTLS